MSEIEIPFRQDMLELIAVGRKVCTSRNKRYGFAGDCFEFDWLDNHFELELTMTERKTLSYVATFLHDAEGFDTPREFINIWNEIHPKKKFDPKQKVWVHWFEAV